MTNEKRLALGKANQAAWALAHPGRVGPDGQDLPTWMELSDTAREAWAAAAVAVLDRAPVPPLGAYLRALVARLFAPLRRKRLAR